MANSFKCNGFDFKATWYNEIGKGREPYKKYTLVLTYGQRAGKIHLIMLVHKEGSNQSRANLQIKRSPFVARLPITCSYSEPLFALWSLVRFKYFLSFSPFFS